MIFFLNYLCGSELSVQAATAGKDFLNYLCGSELKNINAIIQVTFLNYLCSGKLSAMPSILKTLFLNRLCSGEPLFYQPQTALNGFIASSIPVKSNVASTGFSLYGVTRIKNLFLSNNFFINFIDASPSPNKLS